MHVGPSAHRIWSAIYDENCFQSPSHPGIDEQCYERRVFYRIISGLHSTISAHIAENYPKHKAGAFSLEAATSFNPLASSSSSSGSSSDLTEANTQIYMQKLGDYPERLSNLYFTWTVVARAVQKAQPLLTAYNYTTGNSTEDEFVSDQMQHLLSDQLLTECSSQFDERAMFNNGSDAGNLALRAEFQQHFRNVSKIIDCVGCEKCRLHGKLQVLGLGTALRILFGRTLSGSNEPSVTLTRNEIMALVVTLGKMTEALDIVSRFQQRMGIDVSSVLQPHAAHHANASTLDRTERNATVSDSISSTGMQTLVYTVVPFLVIAASYVYLHLRGSQIQPTAEKLHNGTATSTQKQSNGHHHSHVAIGNGRHVYDRDTADDKR